MEHVLQTALQSALFFPFAAFQIAAQLSTWRVAFLRSQRNIRRSGSSGIVKYSTIALDTTYPVMRRVYNKYEQLSNRFRVKISVRSKRYQHTYLVAAGSGFGSSPLSLVFPFIYIHFLRLVSSSSSRGYQSYQKYKVHVREPYKPVIGDHLPDLPIPPIYNYVFPSGSR